MYVLLFVLWFILNGKITIELFWIGAIVVALICAFMYSFFDDFSLKNEFKLYRCAGLLAQYLFILLIEIFKANFKVLLIVLNRRRKVHQTLVTFEADLKTDYARALLANSITLTPGTITVMQDGNQFTVHCLSREMLHGIEKSPFVRLLKEMEG